MKSYGSSINNVASEEEDTDERNYVEKEPSVGGLTNEECCTLLSLLQKTNLQKQSTPTVCVNAGDESQEV